MLVPAVAALDALFCLSQLPLHLALIFAWRGGPRFGAGVAAVDARAAAVRAERALAKVRKGQGRGPGRLALRVLRRTRFDLARVEGSVALGDAAATALAWGGVNALLGGLAGHARRVELAVRPDFGDRARLELRGILTVRAGHIMAVAARCGMEDILRRLKAWTDIPSGPS